MVGYSTLATCSLKKEQPVRSPDYHSDLGIWTSGVSIYSYLFGNSAFSGFWQDNDRTYVLCFNRRTALLRTLWYHVTTVYRNSYPSIFTDSFTFLLRNDIGEKPNRK